MIPRHTTSTLFPYTTLFRSVSRILLGVNAVHGTSIDASGIFRSDAGLGNDVCHEAPPRVPIPDYSLVWRRFKPRSAICHAAQRDRKSTRLNSSHMSISYAVF